MPGTSTDPTLRTVQTDVFADYVGDQIACQRNTSPIVSIFCAELRQHTAVVLSPDQLAVWANEASKLILSDPEGDSESLIAQRAVRTVLAKIHDEVMTVVGPWIPGETVTVRGENYQITGQPCPMCIINPECRGAGWGPTHCPTCGWVDTPF